MAITMCYSCSCGYASKNLDEAQSHINSNRKHEMAIGGTITPNTIVIDVEKIEEAARKRALDAEIMRRARDKGLLK